MDSIETASEPKFAIGMVARLTGLNQHTLRMWERRYAVVSAQRAPNGRRLYSQADVERLILIKHLVDCGDSIGQVAGMQSETLKSRAEKVRATAAGLAEDNGAAIEVGVLGEYLTTQLDDPKALPPGIAIVSRVAAVGRFRAEIKRLRPDALVLEFPVVDCETSALVADLKKQSGATHVVVAYGFGRSADLEALRCKGIQTVRSPNGPAELFSMLVGKPTVSADAASVRERETPAEEASDVTIPPRRYSPDELSKLASRSSAVQCECPKHLVDLVISLSAFEEYSGACEDRNADDAALHAYLHVATAQVRAKIEEALTRVARAEGLLPYPS
jgi:DNA-binding transcriptional MerR regulator